MSETVLGGVIVLIAAGFFYYAYDKSQNQSSRGLTRYVANFDSVDGLVEGSDIRLAGVKIGQVKRTEVDHETYLARVTLFVDRTLKLPKDTSAQIISDGLLGNKYVSLIPGGDSTYLKPQEEIVHTQSSVNLENLIGKALFSSKNSKEASEKN